MMRQRRTLKELDTDLQIDPMVDVVFQLLVFFLFSFHFRQMEILLRTQVARQGAAAVQNVQMPVSIQLETDAGGQLRGLRLQDRVVSLANLPRELAHLRQQRQPEDCKVVLWPADGLHYEHVVAVSQAIVETGWDIRFGQGAMNKGGGP
jgi:biopolymer transport protein ExbD